MNQVYWDRDAGDGDDTAYEMLVREGFLQQVPDSTGAPQPFFGIDAFGYAFRTKVDFENKAGPVTEVVSGPMILGFLYQGQGNAN